MNRKNSCSGYRRYESPIEELLRRNERWNPKKAKKQRQLQQLCREGKLKPFEQPKNYSLYYIHGKTDMDTMDKLIDEAKSTFSYTLDTEGDAYNKISAATIQVEFIRPNSPSTVIIIEVNYLPPVNSPLFIKIRQLCSIILTSNNRIYAWGYVADEFKSFMNLNLFSDQIKADGVNVQNEYDKYELCGLQTVIKSTFGQYLDKTATLAKWSCGIDRFLDTYKPKYVHGREYDCRVREETKYRRMLEEYAINDVFAVTKIAYDMNLIKFLLTPPATIENEPMEISSNNVQQPTSYVYEPISDDELPEIMKIHRLFRQLDRPRQETTSITPQNQEVNESRAITGSFYLGPHLNVKENATENQISSKKRRSNRYRSEVIYPIYEQFKHYQVKQILRGIPVKFSNINIKNGKVFIGMKSPEEANDSGRK